MKRGVLYIVWGDQIEPQLQRSIQSVKKYHPAMPIHVERVPDLRERGLLQKAKMGAITPFESTLYLDADTVLLGNLDDAFQRGEQFGLACCINECPWLRRYGSNHGDAIEYNTGVLFFTRQARPVFDAWQTLAPVSPAAGRWVTAIDGRLHGVPCDDQASFASAVRQAQYCPFILPLNYNFRPVFYPCFFTPLKVWHSPSSLPEGIEQLNERTTAGVLPPTYVALQWDGDLPRIARG